MIMKTKIIFILFINLFVYSCKDEYIEPFNKISACGKEDPLNEIGWLHKKIMESKDPAKLNFISKVMLKKYNGKDVFIIQYPLKSVLYEYYGCSGDIIKMEDIDFINSLTDNDVIYKMAY